MPFNYSQEDVARAIVVEEKVSVVAEIVSTTEEPNSKGDAINQVVNFKVVSSPSDKYNGMMFRAWFSEKFAQGAFEFLRAMKLPPSKSGGNVNFKQFEKKKVIVELKPGTYNDKPANEIVGYRPLE